MKARIIYTCLSIVISFISLVSNAQAQINLSAEVDNPNPKLGERITYTITLTSSSASTPDIIPPDFDGFDIVMGPSSSTSIQMINMNITATKTLTYILRPNQIGTLTIPPAQVNYKGIIRSNSVTVYVGQSAPTPSSEDEEQTAPSTQRKSDRQTESLPRSERGELPEAFVSVSADKTTLYKNDIVCVTYKLYFRVSVNNYNIVRLPQASGFWQEEFTLPQRPTAQDVTVRGKPYKVAIIRRIALFPTRAGTLTLEPMTCDITVERPINRRYRDPFDMFFDDPFFSSRVQREVITSTTEPLTFTVLDLPQEGRPSNFRGDVGNYQLKVEYDKTELKQNDALNIKVTISGAGYLKSIEAPILDLPSGFDQFPPTVNEKISLVGESMRGYRTFNYLVIPRRTGRFEIPAISFSYFNPVSKTYQTVRSGAFEVTVNPGEGGTAVVQGFRSSEVNLMDSDIRFIKSPTGALARINVPPYKTSVYYFLLALPPFLFILGLGLEKVQEIRHSNPIAVRRRKAVSGMERLLIEADKLVKKGEVVKAIETATRGMIELVGAVINQPAAGLTSDAAIQMLRKHGASETLVAQVLELWYESDRVRFAGANVDEEVAKKIIERYKSTAQELEKLD